MRIFRMVWQSMCTALVVTGLMAGLAVAPSAMGSVALAAAVIGCVFAFAVWCVIEPELPSSRAAFVLRGAAFTAVAATATPGLAVVLGGNLLLVALCVVLSSPQLVGRYYRWLESAPRPSAAQFGAAMTAADWASPRYVPVGVASQLRLLTDEELCQRWRHSCVELPAQSSMIPGIGTVEERRFLLEEIERRNPDGFAVWIASDPPRAATLLAHLTESPPSHAQLDWDMLLP